MSQTIPFSKKVAEIVRRGRPFIKMHGLRNDFVIVDGRREPYQPSAEEIIRICDRREGVGGDELLIVTPPGSISRSTDAHACAQKYQYHRSVSGFMDYRKKRPDILGFNSSWQRVRNLDPHFLFKNIRADNISFSQIT